MSQQIIDEELGLEAGRVEVIRRNRRANRAARLLSGKVRAGDRLTLAEANQLAWTLNHMPDPTKVLAWLTAICLASILAVAIHVYG